MGSKTTLYNVEDNGDPNKDLDVASDETETQYLIKWKLWSHIHNTWETESTLNEQKANGLKKLENYKKRMDELNEWCVVQPSILHCSSLPSKIDWEEGILKARVLSVDISQA